VFEPLAAIGDRVRRGDLVALVRPRGAAGGGQDTDGGQAAAAPAEIRSAVDGMVRGLLPPGITVKAGTKAGDIDPRCERSHCFTVSDKALAVAGGVLEAVMRFASLRSASDEK
jgi:xanthine dehydrogenase accessory factor